MARLYGFFLPGHCCGGYGTIEIVGGCCPFLCRLRLSVVGLHFLIIALFGVILVLFVGLVYYKLLILF